MPVRFICSNVGVIGDIEGKDVGVESAVLARTASMNDIPEPRGSRQSTTSWSCCICSLIFDSVDA